MRWYSTQPITREYVKGYGFLSFARKYKKQLLDTGEDAAKTASKKVVHISGEFVGNKTADSVTKSKDDKIVKSDENLRSVEEITIPLEIKDEILNKLRQVLLKMEPDKISKLLNDSFVSNL